MLLNNEQDNNEIKKEINTYLEKNENTTKAMRHSKSSPKREIHSITGLPQEPRKLK